MAHPGLAHAKSHVVRRVAAAWTRQNGSFTSKTAFLSESQAGILPWSVGLPPRWSASATDAVSRIPRTFFVPPTSVQGST